MNIHRTILLEKHIVPAGQSVTIPWTDVMGSDRFQTRGFQLHAPNSVNLTITLRASTFRAGDKIFHPGNSGNHLIVPLATGWTASGVAEWFPLELQLPVQSYNITITNLDTNQSPALTLWALATQARDKVSWVGDMSRGRADAIISSGQNQSSVIAIRGTAVGVAVPAMSTGTAFLGLSASLDGVTFSRVHDTTGEPVLIAVSTSASRAVSFEPALLAAFRWFRFIALQADKSTAQDQSAAKTITLVYRSV